MNRTVYFNKSDDDLFLKAKRIAELRGLSISGQIAKLLRVWVAKQDPKTIRKELQTRADETAATIEEIL